MWSVCFDRVPGKSPGKCSLQSVVLIGYRKAGPLALCFHSRESELANSGLNELRDWQ